MIQKFKKIVQILNSPYHNNFERKQLLKSAIFSGIFIFLFLYLFRPFGLSNLQSPFPILIFLGYGVVTFAILSMDFFLLPILFPALFSENNWKVINEIFFVLWNIFLIGLGNCLYTYLCGFTSLTISSIFSFQIYTLIVGIIPAILFVLIENNIRLKRNLKVALELNGRIQDKKKHIEKDNNEIEIFAENERDSFKTELSSLLFIQSTGNYIEIYFKKNDNIRKVLLRSSLTRIENYIQNYPDLCRCHRTYIINTQNISKITGNSQGYKITFDDSTYEIPVSRNYSKKLREILF